MSSIVKGLNEAFDIAAMQQEYRTRKAEILQNADMYSEKYGIPVDDKYFAEKVMSSQEHESNVAKSNAAREKAIKSQADSQAQQLAQDKQNIEQLKAELEKAKQGFDPNFEYSDDHTYWSEQQRKQSTIQGLEKRIKAAGGLDEAAVPAPSQEKEQAISAYQQAKKLVDQLDKRNKQRVVNALRKDLQLAESGMELTESELMMELSPQTLASYKKKAGADASAADKAGDIKRADKRFSGIVKATKKEFDNDAKGVAEGSLEEAHHGALLNPNKGQFASVIFQSMWDDKPEIKYYKTLDDAKFMAQNSSAYHGSVYAWNGARWVRKMSATERGSGGGYGYGDSYFESEQDVAEAEEVSHLHKALDRALSKEKKASPVQVQRNKERWAQRQKEREQNVAEGDVVQFPKKHKSDLEDMHSCVKCGGDLQSGTYMGHKVKVCMPCKQVYLPPNTGIDKHGNKVEEGYDKWGWHTSVTNGEFMPTKYGNKAYVYLHDMDNQSANGSPQLVTVNKPTVAKKIAQQFGAKVVKTDLNTYRIVKPAEQGNEDMKIDELAINEDWQKVNKKDKTDGMSSKAVKAYRRENPGSKLKTAVTTKPSKLKKGSKAAKRRKSFCARMSGMKKAHASAKTKRDPDSPINKALRRWNCESIEQMQELIMIAESKIAEAKNAKQQAAIAIAKKAAKKG